MGDSPPVYPTADMARLHLVHTLLLFFPLLPATLRSLHITPHLWRFVHHHFRFHSYDEEQRSRLQAGGGDRGLRQFFRRRRRGYSCFSNVSALKQAPNHRLSAQDISYFPAAGLTYLYLPHRHQAELALPGCSQPKSGTKRKIGLTLVVYYFFAFTFRALFCRAYEIHLSVSAHFSFFVCPRQILLSIV